MQQRSDDTQTGCTGWCSGTYSYDGSGNITGIGEDLLYTYDRFNRVTSGTAGPIMVNGAVTTSRQTYEYDRYGNIERITTVGREPLSLGVNAATNQISSTAPPANGDLYAYGTYDGAGNVKTWSTGETFEYDAAGMVREATLDGGKKLYLYSASDERIATVSLTNGTETSSSWTIRDPSGKVLRRLEKSGAGSSGTWTWKQDYIYRGTQLLAAETDGPDHTLRFHPDHLGTPRLITGSGGAKIALHTYYPFGEEATAPVQGNINERLKFTGHERDRPSLDYMHARFYNPQWGRFLSVDPELGDSQSPQTWNRYAYAQNSPVMKTDPDGRVAQWIIGGAVGAVVGIWATAVTETLKVNGGTPSTIAGTARAVVAGAVGGAIAGAIGTTCPSCAAGGRGAAVVGNLISGMGGSAAGGVVQRTVAGEKHSRAAVRADLVGGAAGSAVGQVANAVAGGVAKVVNGGRAMRSAALRAEAAAANQGLRADQGVRRQIQNRGQLLNAAGAATGETTNSVTTAVVNAVTPVRENQ
jgi:RHS repeat-associated protein